VATKCCLETANASDASDKYRNAEIDPSPNQTNPMKNEIVYSYQLPEPQDMTPREAHQAMLQEHKQAKLDRRQQHSRRGHLRKMIPILL